jgi:HEAT repeat protein
MSASALAVAFVGSILYFRRPPDPVVSERPASAWTLDLLSSDYKVRGDAQTALLKLGEAGVPQIRTLLRKGGAPWEQYVNRFTSVFPSFRSDSLDPTLCRQRGAEMIALLGVSGRSAVPELIDSFRYSQAALESEHALLRVGEVSVEPLIRALRARQPEVRAHSAALLKEFLPRHKECVPALLVAVRDPHANVRREAALALGQSQSKTDEILSALVQSTRDDVAEVRAAACKSLGSLGCNSRAVLAAIQTGLADLIPIVRLEAAKAFWTLTHDRDTVIPVLSGVLPTQEGWQAAYILGSMGPAAAPAVPALVEVLKREKVSRAFRTPPSSSLALGQIQEPAIPALEKVLNDREPAVRLGAVLAFSFMGKHARSAIPELLRLLRDPEPEIRQVTAITLASAGADRELVLASLTECLRAEDIYMRSTAAALLREIAPEQDWALSPE